MLGLLRFARAFSSCGKQGLLSTAVPGLLSAVGRGLVASVAADSVVWLPALEHGLGSCGAQA